MNRYDFLILLTIAVWVGGGFWAYYGGGFSALLIVFIAYLTIILSPFAIAKFRDKGKNKSPN